MTQARIELGKWGEELALQKIKQLGYQCIARNYRCALGEIDLIAKHGDCLVFLEIKTRKGKTLGYSKEAINQKKKQQISKVALSYMKRHNCNDVRSRFDVVAISLVNGRAEIEVITNAFELAYG
jgi:putative endonuclease